jgi:hypothetical protein
MRGVCVCVCELVLTLSGGPAIAMSFSVPFLVFVWLRTPRLVSRVKRWKNWLDRLSWIGRVAHM